MKDESAWVEIPSIAYSPDGSILALGVSINDQWRVQLWSTDTWKTVDALHTADNNRINDLAFSPDGEKLAALLSGGQQPEGAQAGLVLWNQTDRTKSEFRSAPLGQSVAFSPNGDWIVSGHENGTILLWRAGTLDEPIHLVDDLPLIRDVAFSTNSAYLAASTVQDNAVRVWNLSGRELVTTIKGHSQSVDAVALIGESPEIWTAGDDGFLKVWDSNTAAPFETIPETGENHGLSRLKGGMIASGNFNNAPAKLFGNASPDARPVRRFAVADRSQMPAWHQGENFRAFAVSDNGGFAAAMTTGNELVVWNVETQQPLRTTSVVSRVEPGSYSVLAVSNTGGAVAMSQFTGDRRTPGHVHLWNVKENRFESPLEAGPRTAVLAFSPDGTQLAADSIPDFRTTLWDLTTTPPRKGPEIPGRPGPDFSLVYSPDGGRIAFANWEGTIRLHDDGAHGN